MLKLALATVAALAFASPALAHADAIDTEVNFSGSQVVVKANREGIPVNGAKFELLLVPSAGDRLDLNLSEQPRGSAQYVATLPRELPAGETTLTLRDHTNPGESNEAQTTFTWPASGPLDVHLEAVEPGPNMNLVLWAVLAPLAIAVLVVAYALLRGRLGPKPA